MTARPDRTRIRVAVVYGGRSSEHAISCVSAGSILRARQLVRSHDTKELQALVEKVMNLSTETEVRETLETFMKETV